MINRPTRPTILDLAVGQLHPARKAPGRRSLVAEAGVLPGPHCGHCPASAIPARHELPVANRGRQARVERVRLTLLDVRGTRMPLGRDLDDNRDVRTGLERHVAGWLCATRRGEQRWDAERVGHLLAEWTRQIAGLWLSRAAGYQKHGCRSPNPMNRSKDSAHAHRCPAQGPSLAWPRATPRMPAISCSSRKLHGSPAAADTRPTGSRMREPRGRVPPLRERRSARTDRWKEVVLVGFIHGNPNAAPWLQHRLSSSRAAIVGRT
jgi:hypothetical protein